jgi:hypothetical protein
MGSDEREHDPQEGPTMREARRARAEVFAEDRARSATELSEIDRHLAAEFGLELRSAQESGIRPSRRSA